MQSHYEINVAKNGSHYFATHERSLTAYDPSKAKAMFDDFIIRFPASYGFVVTIAHYDIVGKDLTEAMKSL